jgi:phosphoglucosamine mutase
MQKKLFGTDGIRGKANEFPMTVETAMKLGRAIAFLARQSGRKSRIIIGKDTRISGYMFETAMIAGISSMGVDTLLAGPIPTPAVAFLTVNMRCAYGVVISASHNPFEDNGIKFFDSEGFKLSDELEFDLENLVLQNTEKLAFPTGENIGRAYRIDDSIGRYIVFSKSSLPRGLYLNGLKIVVDCANGAAYKAGPAVFDELGADVTALGITPNGTNINDACGSLYPNNLCSNVVSTGADIGIAFDGDADRVIFSDEKGNEVDGDKIMGLVALDMKRRGVLRKDTLVATVMSNMGLEVAMRDSGINLIRTDVGDRFVVEKLRSNDLNFGGEQSGHLVFLDHNTSGDGIISALQVLRILRDTGRPLSELVSFVSTYPQLLRNVPVLRKINLDDVPTVKAAMNEAENLLNGRGRLLVRYSGTQMLCRVMAEGENETLVNRVVDMVSDAISRNI